MSQRLYEYVGNIHLHSNLSDGSASVAKIAEAAHREGLDFIALTDHLNVTRRVPGEYAGYRGKVLVIVGGEINNSRNHYLALGIQDYIADEDDHPQRVIDEVVRQGGIGFIAHPFDVGTPLSENGAKYPWRDWDVEGFAGIEIWNFMSDWKAGLSNTAEALYYVRFPLRKLAGPQPETMRVYDRLCNKRPVVAIGGSDAHALTVRRGPLKAKILPYETCFAAVNTHVLTKEKLTGKAEADTTAILEALRRGSCFIGNGLVSSPRGFRMSCEIPGDAAYSMGQQVSFAEGAAITIEAPAKCVIDIYRHGERVSRRTGRGLRYELPAPGIYRAELFIKGWRGKLYPWIFSNPIYVYGQGATLSPDEETVESEMRKKGKVVPIFKGAKK